jgi:hypothetical protein
MRRRSFSGLRRFCRKLTESLPQNGETFIEVRKKMCYDKEQYKKEEEYGT